MFGTCDIRLNWGMNKPASFTSVNLCLMLIPRIMLTVDTQLIY